MSASADGGAGDDVAPDGTGTDGRIAVGETVTGSLESGEDQDWYAVNLDPASTYAIELNRVGFDGLGDPRVRVMDAAGNEVAQNDDGGPGLESALTFSPDSAGTYYLVADNYADFATGRYELGLSADTGADGSPVDDVR